MSLYAAGKIKELNVQKKGLYIKLELQEGPNYTRVHPKNHFFLPITHENYNSLYSLALVSAVNHYILKIRTTEEIVGTVLAEVLYMYVNW